MKTGLRRKKQRIMAVMLVIMLVAGMLPSTSFAGESTDSKRAVQEGTQQERILEQESSISCERGKTVLQEKMQESTPQQESTLQRASIPQQERAAAQEEGTTEEGYVVTVKDTADNVLSGATVKYEVTKTTTDAHNNPTTTTLVSNSATTDETGKAALTGLAAKKTEIEDQTGVVLKLKVTMAGYYDEEVSGTITKVTGAKEVKMTPVYAVMVKDTAGAALLNATVEYEVTKTTTNASGADTITTLAKSSTTTDETGKAALTGLAAKRSEVDGQSGISLKLKVAGYYDKKVDVSITSATGTQEVQLTPVYAVMVKDTDDAALLDATVEYEVIQVATDAGGSDTTLVSDSATTDGTGKAALTKLSSIESLISGYTNIYLKLKVTKDGYAEACNYDDTNKGDLIAGMNSITGTKEMLLEKIVYTVKVEVNGNGTITTTPELNEGEVIVKKSEGKNFTIQAIPNSRYRLVKFEKYVGNAHEVLFESEENDAKYDKKTVEISADTEFVATFAPNKYTVTIQKVIGDDNCEVTVTGKEPVQDTDNQYIVEYNQQIELCVKPSVDYKFDGISKEVGGVGTEIGYRTSGIDVYTSNGILCESDMTIKVKFSEVDIFESHNALEKEGYYSITSDKEPCRTISTADGKTIYVLPNKATKVTLKPGTEGTEDNLYDRVKYEANGQYGTQKDNIKELQNIYLFSNETWAKCTIDCDMEFVIDKQKPQVNIGLPEAAAVENKTRCYNKDVTFTLNVAEQDEGKCSGIQSIKYWIVSNGEKKEEQTLYEYVEGDAIRDTFSDAIQINATENNYDGVEIHVKVTDRAGNEKEETNTINIDTTMPQVSLTYDNNNSYQNSQYFNAARTATIVVKEREDNFDHAKATESIVITAKDANNQDVADAYTISGWQTQRNYEDDNLTTHTATIAFLADANYTLAMSFEDIAGNSNAPIITGDSVSPYAFTVDTKAPAGTVTAKSKEGRSSTWEKLITDLKFGYYSKEKITLSGIAADETSPASMQYYKQVQTAGAAELKVLSASDLDNITDWKSFEGFSVSQDEKFVVYLKIIDSAGNYAYISTDGLIVDEHAPVKEVFEPKVTVEPEQPVNGYYSKDVTIRLKVEDPEVNGTYTGLKEISYKVYNESVSKTEPTQKEELFSFTVKNPVQSDLVQNWEGKIKVDSSKNNSNQVVVEVYAEDNAGNGVTYTKKLKIDVTAPAVNVKYSNNNAVSDKYFNTGRTATIEVTERNFDVSDMKIKITNTDGAAPKVSGWKQKKGTGNGDDTTWTATVKYVQDGNYTFDIAYKDRAGNKSTINYARGTVAAEAFTIDGTRPEIRVSYDNNNVYNGEYYNAARRATVSVTEHNFDPGRVEAVISATENGAAAAVPAISGWTTNGDVHTATISYANDARYTFDISVTDMAGNTAADFAEQSFYVDQTVPELQITGVKDQSANAGDVIPVVTYSDANFDADALHIELTGANRKEVKLDGSYANGSTGGSFTFNNFAKTQDVDDIYVLSATLTDRAGNTVSEEVTFSVNRFGSTYDFSDRTEQINGSYIQASEDIVVVETNPTKLTDIKVTLFQNNETLQLTEGQDYDIQQAGGNGQWYYYTYTIYKDVFQEDGIYKLVLHSKDGAENISENILETKDAEISFGVDKTKPNIVVANLESKQTYALDNMTVIMSASDNLKLTEVMVYLDDNLHAEWKDESLEAMLDQNGDLTFDIPGTSNHAHKVKIVCRDAAGNEESQEIAGFYVTTNLWVRYFNNKPLFYGSLFAMAAALGFIVFVVVKRRKKEEA